ncbi:MAG: radical SAM protein [Deltaproteobacteria bacterium]|nr:radical SAM protein [Deltaproteobacteria bacterium]
MNTAHSTKRLHLITSMVCNNNCLFCIDEAGERPGLNVQDAHIQLNDNRNLESVVFTCGEPTLHGNLIEMIQAAAGLGYKEILLVTNGRRLAYSIYTNALVQAGLTGITVSVHGSCSRVHDRLTRTPGAFEQTLMGLKNLSKLRDKGAGIRLSISTVVQKGNLDDLASLLELLSAFEPDSIVLNAIQPAGRALSHFRSVMERYSLMAKGIVHALEKKRPGGEIVVQGLPFCVSPGGRVDFGHRENIVMRKDGLDINLEPNRGQVMGPPCRVCSRANECGGVFKAYAEHFGWDEFHPL